MNRWLVMLAFSLLCLAAGCGCSDERENECDAISNAIKAEAARLNNVPEGRQPCGPIGQPQFDLDYYAAACQELRECIEDCE